MKITYKNKEKINSINMHDSLITEFYYSRKKQTMEFLIQGHDVDYKVHFKNIIYMDLDVRNLNLLFANINCWALNDKSFNYQNAINVNAYRSKSLELPPEEEVIETFFYIRTNDRITITCTEIDIEEMG